MARWAVSIRRVGTITCHRFVFVNFRSISFVLAIMFKGNL